MLAVTPQSERRSIGGSRNPRDFGAITQVVSKPTTTMDVMA